MYYSRSSPCDHSRKRPVLVTTTFVKPRLNCDSNFLFIYLFYFIYHTIITKNIGKEEKTKWRGDLTETIGAYETLGLLEL